MILIFVTSLLSMLHLIVKTKTEWMEDRICNVFNNIKNILVLKIVTYSLKIYGFAKMLK